MDCFANARNDGAKGVRWDDIAQSKGHSRKMLARNDAVPHNSLALLNANEDTRRVFSSRIKVRVIGGSARWLQFSRSQSRQLTPIGVPSAFSRSNPLA